MANDEFARAFLDRRSLLRAAGLAGLLTTSAACDLLSTDPGAPGGSERHGPKGKEAPMLAKLVKAGKLPPVAKRLPTDPPVVEPVDRIGQYGGSWDTAILGASDTYWIQRSIGYEGLVNWPRDWKGLAGTQELVPGVAKDFMANANGTEFTFTLREGMKWSDGEPFTAADIVFAQNDILNDTDLYPVQENNPTAEKVDDMTVRFVFDKPRSIFLQEQATSSGLDLVSRPMHYLRRFHRAYNKAADQLAKAEGHAGWTELFLEKAAVWENPELPTICAWRIVQLPGQRAVAERNPFYWKVDPDGSQLPYLDRVVYTLVNDPEVLVLKTTGGEIDMHIRHINTLRNKPVLARGREEGGYDFFEAPRDDMNEAILMFNLTHKDPVKREIFGSRDFRIGLSYALNREEIIDVAFQKQGEPWQVAPPPGDQLYDEEMAKQYTDYDVGRANEHLDRVFPERNADGIRLGPDGKPIAFALDLPAGQVPEFPAVLELVKTYWKQVGIDLQVKSEDYALWGERIASNDHDALVWIGDTGFTGSTILEPRYYCVAGYNLYAVRWRDWYASGGREGERPPAPQQRQLDIYDQLLATTDDDEQASLLKKILAIAKEEFFTIGTVLPAPGYGIVRNDFHNVPTMIDGWQWPTPGPSNAEQYFTTADEQ
jgi:ABC-type transport system substrate-binding protein